MQGNSQSQFDDRIAAIRRFNRFHTRLVGALDEGLLKSPYSLIEARLIYEIANHDDISAADLSKSLNLDRGYLSRQLTALADKDLITRTPNASNGKRLDLKLTEKGSESFSRLNAASSREVGELLATLSASEQAQLVGSMQRIERLLGKAEPDKTFILRDPVPGDMGWIVHRHGTLYAQEYGWDWTFEALVAEIVANFVRTYDTEQEKCWVAEREGDVVGSVFLVRLNDETAKLRLLYVEPSARGLGLGRRLVEECMRFARNKGYRRIVLWTNANLHAARAIYEAKGFRLAAEEPHHSFGHDLIGQTWECDL